MHSIKTPKREKKENCDITAFGEEQKKKKKGKYIKCHLKMGV